MRFSLSKTVNPERVFIVRRSAMGSRLDPFYYIPSVVRLEHRAQAAGAKPLRHFVQRIAGGATPSKADGEDNYTSKECGVPFVRVQNLSTSGELNLEDCVYIKRDVHEGLLERSQVNGGDLLIKITGVGRMAVASVAPDGFQGNINQHIVVCKTASRATSEALAAYLNLDFVERLASRRTTGGTRPALDYPALLSIPVISDPRVPVLIRKATSRYLRSEAQARQLLAGIDDLLLTELGIKLPPENPSTLTSRIFTRRFAVLTGARWDPLFFLHDIYSFIRLPKLKLIPLRECVRSMSTGFAAGKGDQAEDDSGIIQIRPTNLSDDRELVFDRNVYIDRRELVERPLDALQRREVLFNNTNSQELVGKSVVFDLPGEFFASNHITRIALHEGKLVPEFLAHLLNLYQRKRVFFRLCTNWNNQSGVGPDVLRNILVPEIPVPVQQRIIGKIAAVRAEAKALRAAATAQLAAAKQEIEALLLGTQAS